MLHRLFILTVFGIAALFVWNMSQSAAPLPNSSIARYIPRIKPKPKPKPTNNCNAIASCSRFDYSCPSGTKCSGMPAFGCYPIGCPTPICLPETAHIDTPNGPVLVTDLQQGDMVWSRDQAGNRVEEPIIQTGSVRIDFPHGMVHVVMRDGRTFSLSAGHPMADGRRADMLNTGESYAGGVIESLSMVPYKGQATYDILPAGETGQYFLEGVPVGSTLWKPAQ